MFLIEIRIRSVVSVLMYDIQFLRHMTSYMIYFVKWSISDRLTKKIKVVYWAPNCVVIGGHKVVMAVLYRFMAPL